MVGRVPLGFGVGMWILYLYACVDEVKQEAPACMAWINPACEWVTESCCDTEDCYWVTEDGEILSEGEYNYLCE